MRKSLYLEMISLLRSIVKMSANYRHVCYLFLPILNNEQYAVYVGIIETFLDLPLKSSKFYGNSWKRSKNELKVTKAVKTCLFRAIKFVLKDSLFFTGINHKR